METSHVQAWIKGIAGACAEGQSPTLLQRRSESSDEKTKGAASVPFIW